MRFSLCKSWVEADLMLVNSGFPDSSDSFLLGGKSSDFSSPNISRCLDTYAEDPAFAQAFDITTAEMLVLISMCQEAP